MLIHLSSALKSNGELKRAQHGQNIIWKVFLISSCKLSLGGDWQLDLQPIKCYLEHESILELANA
jgi:hypothetical protein